MNDETTIRQFLKGTYGAKGPNGELVFDPEKGIIKENLAKVGESRILNGEVSTESVNRLILRCGIGTLTTAQVLDYYVKQYSRHGVHPTRKPTYLSHSTTTK